MSNVLKLTATLLLAIAFVAGCGGSSSHVIPPPPTSTGLYVTNNGSANISGYTGTGTLTAIAGSPFSQAGTQPTWIATTGSTVFFASASPTGLGATAASSGALATNVTLSPTGTIGGIVTTADQSAVIITDTTNRLVQAYKASGNTASAYGTGTSTDTQAGAVAITPDNKFVYVVNDSPVSSIQSYTYDSTSGNIVTTGKTATIVPAPPGVATVDASRAVVDPTGHYLAANSIAGYIFLFVIASDGTLSSTNQVVPVAPNDLLGGLAWAPSGKYLYVVDMTAGQVYGFAVGSGGIVTPISGTPLATGSSPTSVVVDPTGANLYVVNQGSNTVSSYTIGAGGALTAGSSVATGTAPLDLAFTH